MFLHVYRSAVRSIESVIFSNVFAVSAPVLLLLLNRNMRPRRRSAASGLLLPVEFRRHSVSRSVCPSVGNELVFQKNGRVDGDADWCDGSRGLRNRVF